MELIQLFFPIRRGAFTKLTGTYNAVTVSWTTPRTATTVTNPTALTDIAAAVTIATTTPLPDLTITSSAPATATVNTPFNYRLTLANSGTAAATGVSAKFTLAAGVTYNSASGAGFTATQAAEVVQRVSLTGVNASKIGLNDFRLI